jgi:MFS family permease
LYIAEVSPAAHRGEMVTWSEMALNIGVVLGFFSGIVFYRVDDSLTWRLMFISGAILPIVMIILVRRVMPESPRWLVDQGRDEEAKTILQTIYPEGK